MSTQMYIRDNTSSASPPIDKTHQHFILYHISYNILYRQGEKVASTATAIDYEWITQYSAQISMITNNMQAMDI